MTNVAYWTSYHAPEGNRPERYTDLRAAALEFAKAIIRNCPLSADRTAALRKVHEALMTANAGIALNGMSL